MVDGSVVAIGTIVVVLKDAPAVSIGGDRIGRVGKGPPDLLERVTGLSRPLSPKALGAPIGGRVTTTIVGTVGGVTITVSITIARLGISRPLANALGAPVGGRVPTTWSNITINTGFMSIKIS